jgi:hypothetical protein
MAPPAAGQLFVLRRSDFERSMEVNPEARTMMKHPAEARLALNTVETGDQNDVQAFSELALMFDEIAHVFQHNETKRVE